MFPAAYPENVVMSVIPRDCKTIKKSDALPNYLTSYWWRPTKKETLKCALSRSWCRVKIPNWSVKYEQWVLIWDSTLTTSMSVKVVCGRLVISAPLRKALVIRIHCSHHNRCGEGCVFPLHPPEFGGGRGWLQRVHRSR